MMGSKTVSYGINNIIILNNIVGTKSDLKDFQKNFRVSIHIQTQL